MRRWVGKLCQPSTFSFDDANGQDFVTFVVCAWISFLFSALFVRKLCVYASQLQFFAILLLLFTAGTN